MKKLMKTVAASAVALVASGAFADLPSPGAPLSFDALTSGTKYTVSEFVSLDDSGNTGGFKYWFAVTNNNQEASAELATITNDVEQGNYLSIEAGAPLYRTVNDAATSVYGVSFSDSGAAAETIGSNGIYLDTMVKFTISSDETFGDLDTANDKLAITCYSTDETEGGPTNLLVRAGYVVGSTVTATNYVLNLPEEFDIGAWHRLTVRAIADVGYQAAPVGFAIYLDEELLKYGTGVAAGEEAYVTALNGAVKENLYNSETHALLPSLIDSTSDSCGTLSAVGFKGTGSVDDIQFTGDKPSFIVEGQTVTIAWDEGVATYTVVDSNSKTLINGEATSGAAGSTNLTLDAGVTYLTVTATYASGYEPGKWIKTAGTLSNDVWTFAENGASLTIVSMFPQFEVDGDKYGSFGDALENAVGTLGSPATIKMLASWTGDIAFDGENVNYIILDLAGQTLTGDSDAAIHTGIANLTITNSTVEIGHVVAPGFDEDKSGNAVVCDGAATLTVAAGIFDGKIVSDAQGVVIAVTGGKFYDNEYAEDPTEGAFYLAADVDTEKYTISEADENFYFTVSESTPEPPAPTVVQIPTAALNLVYTGNQQTGVAAGEGYTLSGTYAATDAGNYIATATLDQDCVWSDETTAPKEINWSIAADTSATVDVVLTDYEEEYTAQLAFPTASATIGGDAVVGTAAWSPDTITEPAAGATNTYTATFTVTSGNYAGSTGTATFKVYKAAQSGGWDPKPEEIDPSATAATKYPELAETALATANAQKLTAWAEENKVDFAAVKASADTYVDAYLLNCDPADIEDAKADFKATITVNADGTVTVTAPGDYNVTPTIQGKASLSGSEAWHTKEPGDKFFRAILSL